MAAFKYVPARREYRYSPNILVLDEDISYSASVVALLDFIQKVHVGRTLLDYINFNPHQKRVWIVPYTTILNRPKSGYTHPESEADAYTRGHPVMTEVSIGIRQMVMLPTAKFGTGEGTDATIHYTPKDHPSHLSTHSSIGKKFRPGSRSDEDLVHELVHGMRMVWGRYIRTSVSETIEMDHFEEFCAILTTNIYRSERKFHTFLRDHWGYYPLSHQMSDPQTFYEFYKLPLYKWFNSQLDFCLELAASRAPFNPLKIAADAFGWLVRKP